MEKTVSAKAKKAVHKGILISTLIRESETFVLNASERKRLEASEIK